MVWGCRRVLKQEGCVAWGMGGKILGGTNGVLALYFIYRFSQAHALV